MASFLDCRLPFTVSNDPAINRHGGANVNFTTGLAGHLYQTVNNTSYIQANSNVGAGMNYNDFGANKEVRFTIIYKRLYFCMCQSYECR